MRVVGLVSGGKDSCYNMIQCVAAGHEIVALANLQPERRGGGGGGGGGDELDSMMYQTAGHEGIYVYAEAMGLPLYTATTSGQAECRELQYESREGDEVEDMHSLLRRVKDEVGIEGVSVGAVLSDYQRIRVEHICSRLGLVSLAYLWRRKQADLLQEMIEAGVKAIVVKVAAAGLTQKHLGLSISDMRPTLLQLEQRYGVSVCGEGGEYETFTLDCPLFHKRIVIEHSETVVHSDDAFAPVCYLKLLQLSLKDKPSTLVCFLSQCLPVPPPSLSSPSSHPLELCQSLPSHQPQRVEEREGVAWLAGEGRRELSSVLEQTTDLLQRMTELLAAFSLSWRNAVLVHLFLSDMADYSPVNSVYGPVVSPSPPARVCVGMSLPEGVRVRVEVMLCRQLQQCSYMHVQSISHWAPANIGPYSQAYTLGPVVVVAGQIGLLPHSMALAEEDRQPSLSLSHVLSVLLASGADWSSTLGGTCYCTTPQHLWLARQVWRKLLDDHQLGVGCPVVFVMARSLPRGAIVEWHFTALKRHLNVKSHCTSMVTAGCLVTVHYSSWVEEEEEEEEEEGCRGTNYSSSCWTANIGPLQHTYPSDVSLPSCLRKALDHLLPFIHPPSICLLRVFIPKLSLPPPLTEQDVGEAVQEVLHCPVPLSLTTTEGRWDQASPLMIQAWRLFLKCTASS